MKKYGRGLIDSLTNNFAKLTKLGPSICILLVISSLCSTKYGSHILLNTIALRKAKIAYNFGLSECNRVKTFVALPAAH